MIRETTDPRPGDSKCRLVLRIVSSPHESARNLWRRCGGFNDPPHRFGPCICPLSGAPRYRFQGRSGCQKPVPTGAETFEKENVPSLIQRLEDVWQVLIKKGIDKTVLLEKSLLSPATCCLVNPDREKTVEKAFESITRLSRMLREKYRIDD